jgi:SAM-dependent methyltransferase
VIGGIPRLLRPELQSGDLGLVERFDREWREFDHMPTAERAAIFERYFDIVPAGLLRAGALVLDAGCGSGRWAAEVARRGVRVLAMDLGQSVEVAARITAGTGYVGCVQADLRDTPIRPERVDLAYTLGVLHHVKEPVDALRAIVRTLRPGGHLLIYLYYALDDRPAWYRALFRVADALRRGISLLPQPATRIATITIAALAYLPLARLAGLLERIGLARIAHALPLSFYRGLSFTTMRNDSLDRFGTTLESRYTRDGVIRLMHEAGLSEIVVSPGPPYWHALGVKRDR